MITRMPRRLSSLQEYGCRAFGKLSRKESNKKALQPRRAAGLMLRITRAVWPYGPSRSPPFASGSAQARRHAAVLMTYWVLRFHGRKPGLLKDRQTVTIRKANPRSPLSSKCTTRMVPVKRVFPFILAGRHWHRPPTPANNGPTVLTGLTSAPQATSDWSVQSQPHPHGVQPAARGVDRPRAPVPNRYGSEGGGQADPGRH